MKDTMTLAEEEKNRTNPVNRAIEESPRVEDVTDILPTDSPEVQMQKKMQKKIQQVKESAGLSQRRTL
jgi:hypothetical protein